MEQKRLRTTDLDHNTEQFNLNRGNTRAPSSGIRPVLGPLTFFVKALTTN